MPTFDKESYLSYIEISASSRILVEGVTDKIALKLALKTYDKLENSKEIEIDTAENLIDFENVLGNKGKVEKICEDVRQEDLEITFLGLVDREHRKFQVSDKINSKLNGFYRAENLFWTHGHSLENYLFDPEIVCDGLLSLTNSPNGTTAIEDFSNLFPSIIEIATALILTVKELGLEQQRSTTCINWTSFLIKENRFELNLDIYKKNLFKRGYSKEDIQKNKYVILQEPT